MQLKRDSFPTEEEKGQFSLTRRRKKKEEGQEETTNLDASN